MKSADPFYDVPITARDLEGTKVAFTDNCRSMLQQHQYQLLKSKKRQRVREETFNSDNTTTKSFGLYTLHINDKPIWRSNSKRIKTREKSSPCYLHSSESTSSSSSPRCFLFTSFSHIQPLYPINPSPKTTSSPSKASLCAPPRTKSSLPAIISSFSWNT